MLAIVLTLLGISHAADAGLTAKEVAKLIRLETIVCLLAMFLGLVGRTSTPGKIGLAISLLMLLAAAAVFAWSAFA